MLPRIPAWYELLLGMFRHGVVPMPATTLCTARDIAQRIERAAGHDRHRRRGRRGQARRGARSLLVAAPRDRRRRARRGRLRALRRADGARQRSPRPTPRVTRADDPLLLYFTSGTVAAPKMVLHTHASMGARARDHGALLAGPDARATSTGRSPTPAGPRPRGASSSGSGAWASSVFLWDQRGKLDPERMPARARRSGVDDVLRAADALPRASCSSTSRPSTSAALRHCRVGRASR